MYLIDLTRVRSTMKRVAFFRRMRASLRNLQPCNCYNVLREFQVVASGSRGDSGRRALIERSATDLADQGCRGAEMRRLHRLAEKPERRRAVGVPQFVTVRGGAYLFPPSLRALKWNRERVKTSAWVDSTRSCPGDGSARAFPAKLPPS